MFHVGDTKFSLEELEKYVGNVALIIVRYYRALISLGVPIDLAYRLVMEFHYKLLSGNDIVPRNEKSDTNV